MHLSFIKIIIHNQAYVHGVKLEITHSMLGDAGSHVEPSSEFGRLRGRHFAEVIPATEKRKKHASDV